MSAIFLLLAYVYMEDTGCIVNLFIMYRVKIDSLINVKLNILNA